MRLQAEIDNAISQYTFESLMPMSVIGKMPYLQACICEGIRTIAPLFFLLDRKVAPEGACLHGYQLPGGTLVSLNMLAAQSDNVYGDDAQHYRPERWITDDTEHYRQMRRTMELVFGDGSTKCLGIHLAFIELSKIVFE
jgi:cytochrome P450